MPREYGQVNPDGTISVIRENDDGTYEVVRTESREKNQGIQPKAATSSGGAGGGGTNPFPGAEFVNPDLQKLFAQIIDWAATQEFNRRRLEEVDKPTLQLQKDIAAFNQAVGAINSLISAAGLQSQEALGVAGIIANLRGPSSAFKQMEVAYGLNQSGATRSFDALAGKYSMPSFQAPQGTPEAVSLATLSRDMQQVGGQTGQMSPIERAIKAVEDLMAKFGSNATPGASTPGGSTPMTDEQALDWIWANVDAKHPQLKQTYAANGWASDTPEQRRAIIQNWIGQADPQWKGMNPLQVAAKLGYTAPTPTQEQVLNNAGAKTGIGTGAATGPTQTPLSNNVSASSGMVSSGPLGQQTTYRPGVMTPAEQQRAIAYNEALRAAGKQTEDFRMPPAGWEPGMPVQYQQPTGQPGFTAPTIKGTPGSLGGLIEQQGRSHLYSGNPRAWADLNALPGATNKIAGKEFLKMDPYGQQVALGAYETAGYAPEFTLDQIQKGLPRFRAPRMGVVA